MFRGLLHGCSGRRAGLAGLAFLLMIATGTPTAAATRAAGASVVGPSFAAAAVVPASVAAVTPRRRVARPIFPDTAIVSLGPARSGAFVAYPPGGSAAPGMVIVHEWWGLNAQIREMARRLAREGYVTIVPDLYGGKIATDGETAHILTRGLDEAEALRQIAAAAGWLAAEPRIAKRRLGVMGFCMGGRLALEAALREPSFSAVVMFYGAPESRVERLVSLKAPLLGHFGADDQGISVDRVDSFGRMLKGAGKLGDVHIYPDAGHAFMNESQPGYRADAARLAWVRTLDFLQKHVKALP
ncbi:MAG: dienelactone hydrolase family protein [Candidatus Eisenbacteria bacterium]